MDPDSGRAYIFLSIIAMVLWAKFVQDDDLAGREAILNRMFLTASAADNFARQHGKREPQTEDEFQSYLIRASLHIQDSDKKFWDWLSCRAVKSKAEALKLSKTVPPLHVLYCVEEGSSSTHYYVIGKDARGGLARFSADDQLAILEPNVYCKSWSEDDTSNEENRQSRIDLLSSNKSSKDKAFK